MTSLVLNIAALAASVIAVVMSTRLSARQTRLMRASNHVPVILDYFRDRRSGGFVQREFSVREEIGKYDWKLGFTGLPEPLRTDVHEVCYFYLDLIYLSKHGDVDAYLIEYIRYPLLTTWDAVRSHVEGERVMRGPAERGFLHSLEAEVERLRKLDPLMLGSARWLKTTV